MSPAIPERCLGCRRIGCPIRDLVDLRTEVFLYVDDSLARDLLAKRVEWVIRGLLDRGLGCGEAGK